MNQYEVTLEFVERHTNNGYDCQFCFFFEGCTDVIMEKLPCAEYSRNDGKNGWWSIKQTDASK